MEPSITCCNVRNVCMRWCDADLYRTSPVGKTLIYKFGAKILWNWKDHDYLQQITDISPFQSSRSWRKYPASRWAWPPSSSGSESFLHRKHLPTSLKVLPTWAGFNFSLNWSLLSVHCCLRVIEKSYSWAKVKGREYQNLKNFLQSRWDYKTQNQKPTQSWLSSNSRKNES